MINKGQFRDTENNLYEVTITSEIGGSVKIELEFGDTPFTSSVEGNDFLYKPARYTSATVNLISRNNYYYFDIYSGKPQGTKVEVVKNGNVVFKGYAEPTLYNIGYESNVEELSIDCIDGLASLQYFEYEPINGSAGVHTLIDIIEHCVRKAGCYDTVVADISTIIDGTSKELLLYGLVSEQNFISSYPEEKTQKDTKTYQDVLEAICQYLCLTATADGSTVYLIDYDTMTEQSAKCAILDLDSREITTDTWDSSRNIHIIGAGSYAEGGAQLSLAKVYSKVTVSNDLKTFDALLANPFDGAQNITIDDAEITGKPGGLDTVAHFGEYVKGSGDDAKMLAMLDRVNGAQNNDSFNAVFVKYYSNNNFKLHHYASNNGVLSPTTFADEYTNYTMTHTYHGAYLAKMDVSKLDKMDFDEYAKKWYSGEMTIDEILARQEKSTVSFSEMIVMYNGTKNHITPENADKYPYLSTTIAMKNTALFGGKNAFLLVSGSVIVHDKSEQPYPIPDGEVDLGNGRYLVDLSKAHLLARLEWNGKFFDGESWVSSAVNFRIPYLNQSRRFDAVHYKENKIVNTVTWRDGIKDEGFKIPLPSDGEVLKGQPKLTIYAPLDLGYYNSVVMVLKNFKVSAVVSDPTFSGSLDDDTVYTNIIDEGFADEMDEIKLSVTTYDNKKPCYNAVAYDDKGKSFFVDKTTNVGTQAREVGTELHDGSVSADGAMRQEEHLLWRSVNQYSHPAIELEISLKSDLQPCDIVSENNLNKTFCVTAANKDYKYNTYKFKLTEKK